MQTNIDLRRVLLIVEFAKEVHNGKMLHKYKCCKAAKCNAKEVCTAAPAGSNIDKMQRQIVVEMKGKVITTEKSTEWSPKLINTDVRVTAAILQRSKKCKVSSK